MGIASLYQSRSSSADCSTASMRCPLLDLPVELRLLIYKTLFGNTTVQFSRRRSSSAGQMTPIWSILQTCRKVYDEANYIWLGEMEFAFESQYPMWRTLHGRTGRQLRAIKRVRLGATGSIVQNADPENGIGGLAYYIGTVLEGFIARGLRPDYLIIEDKGCQVHEPMVSPTSLDYSWFTFQSVEITTKSLFTKEIRFNRPDLKEISHQTDGVITKTLFLHKWRAIQESRLDETVTEVDVDSTQHILA